MDKKFLSGLTFGVVLGTVVSLSIPMFAAKDIVIGKPVKSSPVQTKVQNNTNNTVANSGLSPEIVQQLKEINASLKENAEQNNQIITQLQGLNKKNGL